MLLAPLRGTHEGYEGMAHCGPTVSAGAAPEAAQLLEQASATGRPTVPRTRDGSASPDRRPHHGWSAALRGRTMSIHLHVCSSADEQSAIVCLCHAVITSADERVGESEASHPWPPSRGCRRAHLNDLARDFRQVPSEGPTSTDEHTILSEVAEMRALVCAWLTPSLGAARGAVRCRGRFPARSVADRRYAAD